MNFLALLEFGFAGVSFALVYLAYDLMRRELKKTVQRPRAIHMIYAFMGFAIIFALLNFFDAARTLAAANG